MRQTVVGAFNEYAAAQRAADYLASQGIERDHIHVQGAGAADEGQPSGSGDASGEGHEDRGVIANVRSFFAEVFGPESERGDLRHHRDALQQGSARVVVDVDEDWQVTEVCRKLKSAGALELDQHVSEWRSAGWSGFDEGVSTAYAADRVPASQRGAGVHLGPADTGSAGFPPAGEHLGSRSDDAHLAGYREHWNQNYAVLGGRYEDYDPAYRYGHALASDVRHQGQAWAVIEPNVRSEWEASHPGSTWESVRDSVRHAWERASGQPVQELSYREHFDRNYSHTGAAYDEYEPAYRYGKEMAGESRYQGQDWVTIEATARQEWDARHGASGSTWERIKEAVKQAWERARH